VHFRLFEQEWSREEQVAKLGANGHSLQATPGHNQLASVQLDSSLGDTRRPAATLERCLLSRGSRVRILTGAPGQQLSDRSNALRCLGAKRGTRQRVMTHAKSKRRGHGDDSIYSTAYWPRTGRKGSN
jgi:hypothetical protein